MPSAALAIASGRIELLVAERTHTLVPLHRSACRLAPFAPPRLLDFLATARALGAERAATVVAPTGHETALAARLALAAGSEVRLLRPGDERALVFAGATLDLPTGTPVTVCTIEDGSVDVVVGHAGSTVRWAASVVAAHAHSVPLRDALLRLGNLVERFGLPREGAVLLAGSGARSLRLALAPGTRLRAHAIVEEVCAHGLGRLEVQLGITSVRARRVAFAAALAASVERATLVRPAFAPGGLLEGALLHPVGLIGNRALEPLEELELALAAGA